MMPSSTKVVGRKRPKAKQKKVPFAHALVPENKQLGQDYFFSQ
jgi:hypothetical protein